MALILFGLHSGLLWTQAAGRGAGFVRSFWKFQATGFAVWTLAQALATVFDGILDSGQSAVAE